MAAATSGALTAADEAMMRLGGAEGPHEVTKLAGALIGFLGAASSDAAVSVLGAWVVSSLLAAARRARPASDCSWCVCGAAAAVEDGSVPA